MNGVLEGHRQKHETQPVRGAPKYFIDTMKKRVKLLARSVVFPYSLTFLMVASAALAQTQPSAPQTPPASTTQTPNPAAAPPPPLPPDEYKNLSDISVELYYWKQTSHPIMRPGKANVDGDSATVGSSIDFSGSNKPAYGILVTSPAGRANLLEFEYFQTSQQGNTVAPINLYLFGQPYGMGDVISTNAKIQHARATWNYLTYPDPAGARKFRFRTLWGIEWTQMTARFDAPADPYAAPVQDSRSIIFPSLGVAAEYHFSKKVSFDAKIEGFAWPHKAEQADAEARFLFRVYKQLDLVAAYRGFFFKTNPEKDYYLQGLLRGPYAGLRWTFK